MSHTLLPTALIVISVIRKDNHVLINLKVIKYHYPQRSTAWSTWATPLSLRSWDFHPPCPRLPQLWREETLVQIAGFWDNQDSTLWVNKDDSYWILWLSIWFAALRIAETSVQGVYQLELERLAKCGVSCIFSNIRHLSNNSSYIKY